MDDFMHKEKKKKALIKATMIVANVIMPKMSTKSLRVRPCSAHIRTSIVASPDNLSSALLLKTKKVIRNITN